MLKLCNILFTLPLIVCLSLITQCSINNDEFIVPESGYDWPDNNRSYWPTNGWQLAPIEDFNIDPSKMDEADQFAANDPLARALLVVKDGYIVYENYYGNGGIDESTNLWSCTKSVTSALVGFIMDENIISSTDEYMVDLMPYYPEFNDIKLHHVLNMTTGLSWTEEGPLWVNWIFSDDWVAAALGRGQIRPTGKTFKYSSANTHFLTSLVNYKTNTSLGELAKERLFNPLGIEFLPMSETIVYDSWFQYLNPAFQTWRQDNKGIECGGFGLYLKARDMAKFGYLYLNRGRWENQQIISENWVKNSTRDHKTDIYGRYSYGYHWWMTKIAGHPSFLASGWGGQIIGVVPSLDLVVVLKYEAENPVHPVSGSNHDDMHLFELVVRSVATQK